MGRNVWKAKLGELEFTLILYHPLEVTEHSSFVLDSSFACGSAQLSSRASPQRISPQFSLTESHLSVYRFSFLFL